MVVRVYELAKRHGLSTKEMISALGKLGYPFENHMASVPQEALDAFERERGAAQVATSKKQTKNVEKPKERKEVGADSGSEKSPAVVGKIPVAPVAETKLPVMERAVGRVAPVGEKVAANPVEIVVEPMTVGDFVQRTGLLLGEIILTLLKQGIVANKNQVLSEAIVGKLMRAYGIQEKKVVAVVHAPGVGSAAHGAEVAGTGVARQPIVVVMGHVDHGKTTLLDFIRKTRVAAREKGNITQHLGAYEVTTPQGKITFLDTPGHAAFSMIRSRGTKIADIAVLVVAADDGMKPQTIEALEAARRAGLPIIVALNKVDRVTPAQIEVVKGELARHDLVPEDWGGQAIVVPISAKTGQGVDALLEVIALQAQVLELHASAAAPARGFVIEAGMERGLGPVGTVIMRNGALRVGDQIVVGDVEGRVSVLIDAYGKQIREAAPSMPVLVAGLKELPHAGDELVVSSLRALRGAGVVSSALREQARGAALANKQAVVGAPQEDALCIVLKADNASSLEAVLGSIKKLPQKNSRPVKVLQSGVGPISESDVLYAAETGSHIFGLHVKWEPRAAEVAQKLRVTSSLFDIIYALLDAVAQASHIVRTEKILKKIGEAMVLKVFEIKNMGVIAGAQVKSGLFVRDGLVKVFRGKQLTGEGKIKSLQRERKAVKEVHTGFECAFLVEGISDWHVDDRVECYQVTVVEQS